MVQHKIVLTPQISSFSQCYFTTNLYLIIKYNINDISMVHGLQKTWIRVFSKRTLLGIAWWWSSLVCCSSHVMMHTEWCHRGGKASATSGNGIPYGLGSESTPTTSLGYAAVCGGNDRRVLTKNVCHFLIQFTIGTDANASPFCKAL